MIRIALAIGLLILSGLAVATFPRSVLAFLLFQGSVLIVYVSKMPPWLRASLLAVALLVMMPAIGAYNGYYLEVATQVGIFDTYTSRIDAWNSRKASTDRGKLATASPDSARAAMAAPIRITRAPARPRPGGPGAGR